MTGAPSLAVRLAEAVIFASSEPVGEPALLTLLQAQGLLPEKVGAEKVGAEKVGAEKGAAGEQEPKAGQDAAAALRDVLAELVEFCEPRGVRLVQVAGGWQFRTAPDLAPHLTKVMQRPRRLPRSAMETLSVIAYHQPCTRTEIEEIRGVSLSQSTLDSLLEASLIAPRGRKEVPGRPVLWGTSQDFLRHFGLRDLRDLPRREELLVELPALDEPAAVPAAPEPC